MKKNLLTSIIIVLVLLTGTVKAQLITACQFSSADPTSYIDCGLQPDLFPNSFTIEAWALYDELGASGGYIMANEGWDNGTGTGMGFSLRLQYADAKPEFSIGAGSGWDGVSGPVGSIVVGEWIHLAVTVQDDKLEIYINGVLSGEKALAVPMGVSTQNLSIAEGAMWKGRGMTGKIRDIRIWNYARSASEISSNMNADLTGTEAGLLANWKMDEGSGTTAHDATGVYDLTLGAGTTWFSTVGLNKNISKESNISAYPNPAPGYTNVKNNYNESVIVTVKNAIGQTVKTIEVPGKSTTKVILPVQKGMYFVGTNDSRRSINQKLIVY